MNENTPLERILAKRPRKFSDYVFQWKSLVGQTIEGTVTQISESGDVGVNIDSNIRGILRSDRYPGESKPKPGDVMKFIIVSAGKDPETPKYILLWFTRIGLSAEDKSRKQPGLFPSEGQVIPFTQEGINTSGNKDGLVDEDEMFSGEEFAANPYSITDLDSLIEEEEEEINESTADSQT